MTQEGVPKTTPFRVGHLFGFQEFSLLRQVGVCVLSLLTGFAEGLKSLIYP